MKQRLKLEIIDSLPRFHAIRDSWAELRNRVNTAFPFDSHGWLASWWAAATIVSSTFQFRVALVWNDTHLVAALPLALEVKRRLGIPIRELTFMGGHWGVVSALIDPKYAEDAARELVAIIYKHDFPKWHVLHIAPLVLNDAGHALLAPLQDRGARTEVLKQTYLELDESWEAFLAHRSRNFRRTVKRKLQGAAEAGLVLECIRNPTSDIIEETVTMVSQSSWQGREGKAITSTEFGRKFYNLVSTQRADLELDLVKLKHESTPIAYLLSLRSGRVYHAFDTGFDPSWAELSPGLVVHFAAIERAHEGGQTEFNFGYDAGYKERFDPLQRDTLSIRVFRSGALAVAERSRNVIIETWGRIERTLRRDV